MYIGVNVDTACFLFPQWKTLTKEQQATYFQAAEREKILHALQHPDWSFKNNYVRIKFACCQSHAVHSVRDNDGRYNAIKVSIVS